MCFCVQAQILTVYKTSIVVSRTHGQGIGLIISSWIDPLLNVWLIFEWEIYRFSNSYLFAEVVCSQQIISLSSVGLDASDAAVFHINCIQDIQVCWIFVCQYIFKHRMPRLRGWLSFANFIILFIIFTDVSPWVSLCTITYWSAWFVYRHLFGLTL